MDYRTPSGRPLRPAAHWTRRPSVVHRGWERRLIIGVGLDPADYDEQWEAFRDRLVGGLRATSLYADASEALDGFRGLVDDVAGAADAAEVNAAMDWLYDWLDAERVLLSIRADDHDENRAVMER